MPPSGSWCKRQGWSRRPGRGLAGRGHTTFATVSPLALFVTWYRAGEDVGAHLPALSAYLGHVEPKDTYWYLSAVPELLSLANDRAAGRRGHQS